MQERIITIYCLYDEFLKATGCVDLPGTGMSTAEVMTTALVAADVFGGCFERSRAFLATHGYIPHMLSKSRFNRRLHALPEGLWQGLFLLLSSVAQQGNERDEYIVDSCPVPVCDNLRIRRCQLYRGQAYRGYLASKHRYFFGLRSHLLVTATDQPVEFVLAPGAQGDITAFYVAQGTCAMEMPCAWTEHAVERRISLALLAGSLLKAIATACDSLPMGPWDRKPARSAGRLANYLGLHVAHFGTLALKEVAPRTYRKITPAQERADSLLPLAA